MGPVHVLTKLTYSHDSPVYSLAIVVVMFYQHGRVVGAKGGTT